ncbi:hypothetical protein, partial [Cohnella zeiphila]|nr:hypothetical protein [Cohnella zeiphila]
DLERIERLASPRRERPVRLLRKLFDAAAERPAAGDGGPAGTLPLRGLAAVLAATAPELFAFREWRASVVAGDGPAAGMVIADRRADPSPGSGPYVRFCVDVEAERAIERFVRVMAD